MTCVLRTSTNTGHEAVGLECKGSYKCCVESSRYLIRKDTVRSAYLKDNHAGRWGTE